MDYKAIIKQDLEAGFSKIELERLIGLPKNNLASVLTGNRELSKKSQLKVEKWAASEKPNPLDLIIPKKKEVKVQDFNKPTNKVEPEKPLGSKKSNYSIDTANKKEGFRERLPNESSIDYQLRKAGIDPSTVK